MSYILSIVIILKDFLIFIKFYRKRDIFFFFLGIFGKIRFLFFLFYYWVEWEDMVSYFFFMNI